MEYQNNRSELKQKFDSDTFHQIAELETMRMILVRHGLTQKAALIETQIQHVKNSRAAAEVSIFRNDMEQSA